MRHFMRLLLPVAAISLISASVLASAGSGAKPGGGGGGTRTCDLTQLQLRDSTVNQGLGSYDRLVRGKATLVRLYFSLPSCAGSTDQIQITGGSLTVTGANTTLASGIAGTPDAVATFPTVAPYGVAPLLDAPADIKFVVPGSALAPSSTTAAFTASFRATITFTYTGGTSPATATFTSIPSKTVEGKTNALRILVVPMGNAQNSYSAEFPSEAVAAVENGMQTLGRIFPVPDGVGTLGGTTGGIRYAITPTLLNVTTPFCGDASNFDAIKSQLAQFLSSWNASNPNAQADRVVGAVASTKSLGSNDGCAEGMASLVSPEAWVRAFPDTSTAPSMTGALFAMEIAHTFGDVPSSRSFGTFHSLNTAADGTSPNRAYNVTLRSYISDDHSAMKLSGTWNNNTTVLEQADYAFLLCVLGGQTNTECTTSAVVGSSTGVAAIDSAFSLTGHTDGTAGGTVAQESFVASDLQGRGTDATSEYRLVQRNAGNAIVQNDGVRVAFEGTIHHEAGDPGNETNPLGTFAVVVGLNLAAEKFELWKGDPNAGGSLLLYTANKVDPPSNVNVNVTPSGVRNFTNTTSISEYDPSLSADERWVAYSRAGRGIWIAPTSDREKAVNVPFPVLPGQNGDVLYATGNQLFADDPTDALGPTMIYDGTADGIFGVHDPEWSPDGTKVVFSGAKDFGGTTNFDIYTVDRYRTAPARRLTTDAQWDTQPSWSRKGVIVFVRGDQGGGGSDELYSVRADGTGETRLTDDSTDDQNPEVSPDGNTIAWQTGCGEAGGGWNVCTMPIGGGAKTNLTPDTEVLGNALNPEWSPEGDQIAFNLTFSPFGPADSDIYRIVDIGTEFQDVVQVTNQDPGSEVRETNPQWSGDGQDLIIEVGSPGDTSFETIPYHGDGAFVPVDVAGADDWAFFPDFTTGPAFGTSVGDGAKLAFVYGESLYTLDVDLSGATPVFGDPVLLYEGNSAEEIPDPVSPTWSEDESQIAFQTNEFPVARILRCDVAPTPCTEPTDMSIELGVDSKNPSWSRDGTNRIAFDVAGDGTREIWTVSNSDVNDITMVVGDGANPAFRSDGALVFDRFVTDTREIWIATDPGDSDTESRLFEPGDVGGDTNPAVAGEASTYAFERTTALGGGEIPAPITDIMVGSPDATGVDVNVSANFDIRALLNLRLDLIVDCGTLHYVVAVALRPDSISGTTAFWTAHFDPSLTCANPIVRVVVVDGYNRVTGTDTSGTEVQPDDRPPTAAIYTPSPDTTFLQYDLVPATGAGWDAEDGTLPDANLAWKLIKGGSTVGTGSGPAVDFSPPAGGWALGDYTLELTATDSHGQDDVVTRTFTIVADADHDGIPATEDKNWTTPCVSGETSGDSDPLNSFADYDSDGIPNVDDDGAICTKATSYEATIDVDPDMTYTGSNGVLTAYVTLRYRPITAVDGSTVHIVAINNMPADIPAIRWNLDKKGITGIAKFDRNALFAYFAAHGISGGPVLITIEGSGSSGGAAWTFTGADTTLVH